MSATDERRMYTAVGSLPCQRCQAMGQEQSTRTTVAHSNQLAHGKGRGLKAPWWKVAALCERCHVEIDQGTRLSKTERRDQWDAAHQATIDLMLSEGLLRPAAL